MVLLLIFSFLIVLKKKELIDYFFIFDANVKNKFFEPEKEKTELWLNIFIHGTVGVTLTFLDFPAVKADSVENSIYKKTVNVMRKNKCFYQDQPISDKGLLRIEPSFERDSSAEFSQAGVVISKGFEEVSSWYSHPGIKQQNIYYLFGWTGVLSQKRRRIEAMRFFNQLSEEVDMFRQLGFNPKIRLLTHSHGGNLCLNLAGFFHSLDNHDDQLEFFSNYSISSIIKKFFTEAISTSFEKEVAISKKGQKRFDYYPEKKDLFVDELIMFGTPLQEETILFIESPFFGKVYNIYSDADLIQGMDYVSTVKSQSLQRIEDKTFGKNKFFQIKVVVEPCQEKGESFNCSKAKLQRTVPWWQVLLGLRDTSRSNSSPTHKEFWFLVPDDKTPHNFLRPMPIVCLFPIIKMLQENDLTNRDMDFEVSKTDSAYSFKLKSECGSLQKSITLDRLLIDGLRNKFYPWIVPRDNAKIMKKIMKECSSIRDNHGL